MKIITTKNTDLGFRELGRLTSFVQLMITNFPNDCCNATFVYDFNQDEPCIITENEEKFFASDYDIGFDYNYNAEFI